MAMGEVFKLFGTLGVNTKPADDALDKTTEKAKKTKDAMTFQKKVDDSIVRAGNNVLKVGGILAGVAATAATFALKGGISRALNIENAEAKLRGLGHAGETVDLIMSNALASVKGTAFGLDAAATTAANAVAAGIKPGQQLEGVLKTVANSAALAGADMGEMGAIFNKVATSNKVQMDVINQLHDRGIPALQFLANEMGVTAEKASEMASKGEIDFATFAAAMEKGVGTAAVEMGNTTTGAWSNMLAAASRVGAAVVKDIMPKVKDFFTGFTKWLDDNSDKIVGFVSAFLDGFGKVAKWMGENQTLIKNVAIVIGSLLIPALLRYIQLQTIAGVQALIAGAKMMAGWLMALGPIGLIIAAVVAAAALIIANWEWIRDTAISIWTSISDWFKGVWDGVVAVWTTVWTTVVAFFTGLWNGVVSIWTTVWTAISDFFTGVWNGIVAAFQLIWQIFLDFLTIAIGIPLAIINTILIQPLIALWNWAWQYISAAFSFVWDAIVAAITWYINLVLSIITAVLDFLVPIWEAVWGAISDFFKGVWDGIVTAVTWYVNLVMTIITTVIDTIKTVWTNVWNAIKTFFVNIWNGIVNFVTPIINTIKSTITNTFNAIKTTVTNIFNAIKSAIEKPINAAKDIVQKAIDAIKGFFSFKISWPKIPMPRFGIKPAGWKIGDLLQGKIPSLDISFHKLGGIMTKPTLFGMDGNTAMVGGEAGNEAILPLTREVLGKIGEGIADTMGGDESIILEALLAEIQGLRDDQKELSVILDSSELVGALRKKIDQALEKDANRRRRGVTP